MTAILIVAGTSAGTDNVDYRYSRLAVRSEFELPSEDSKPISIEAVYTADVWALARGGVQNDVKYPDNFDLIATAPFRQWRDRQNRLVVEPLRGSDRLCHRLWGSVIAIKGGRALACRRSFSVRDILRADLPA